MSFTLFASVCCRQSRDDIPILSEVSSATKALYKQWDAQIVQCEDWHMRCRVMLLLITRQPFHRGHSLPNGVWLHIGEAACTFTPDSLGQNSCSEHLSYGGSSLIVILNRSSYPVWPDGTRTHGLQQGLVPQGPNLKKSMEKSGKI